VIVYRTVAESQDTANAALLRALPRYAKPPVVEVALSVQFDALSGFELVHFGQLWQRLRDRYPRTEHREPLNTVVELFGVQAPQRASLQLISGFPVGRAWYLSQDGLRLLQVQPNRFILNWRKLDTGSEYPSYETLKKSFHDELNVFLSFVAENSLGEFEPRQCELTYINHIFAGSGWATRSDLPQILTLWSGNSSEPYLPDLEDAQLAWQYRFDESGIPLGRLHVQLQSAVRQVDNLPLFILELTGRGAPIGSGIEGVLAFTDRAHEWIVRGFTAMTTEQMHAIWERQQ
jgi:uncharacterized protein (TIGR04255 family)